MPATQSFRDFNDEIERGLRSGGDVVPPGLVYGFMCECADECCGAMVHVTLAEYRRIRTTEGLALAAPEHRERETHVVERHESHWICR